MVKTFSEKSERILLFSLMISIFLFLVYIINGAKATYDSGDGLTHYFISRYSWKHPELLLHHWGKPFFTLASSPFSQFGLVGMNVFQIVCGLATSFFCFQIAKKLELRFAWLLPIFICFTPIYFAVINSGLTEIFFACVLVFSIWMVFEKRFVVAAIAASLLPFVRVDAYVTVPLIAFIFCIRKQFAALPFLLTGFIIYSIIGSFYFSDSFWVIHQSQNFFDEGYPGMKGELFHYPKMYKEIWGASLSLLLVGGLIYVMYNSYSVLVNKTNKGFLAEEIILIYGSFFACLLIHTLSYCLPGVLNNLGMTRYMVTLIPCAALIALRGLNILISPVKKNLFLTTALVIIFSAFIFISPFKQSYYPFRLDDEQLVTKEAAGWMKSKNIANSKIYYSSVSFPLFYEIDPFDNKKAIVNINLDEPLPSSYFPQGSVMVWDTHYGSNEGRVTVEKLKNNKSLQLLQTFVGNNGKFEVRIYKVK
ncbi:MAG: hypothetical protein ABIT08_17830 [Bacteroidia bacterium]